MEINYFSKSNGNGTEYKCIAECRVSKRASTGSYLRSSKRILGRREEIHECNP